MNWVVGFLLIGYSLSFLDYVSEKGWDSYCFQEKKGSPINIITSSVDYTTPFIQSLQVTYKTQFFDISRTVVDNEKFQVSYKNTVENYVTFKKNNTSYRFDISNIHYHCESEHHVDGN